MLKDFPEARSGQPLTPEMWNQARAFARSLRLLQGNGIRLHYTVDGTTVSADRSASAWAHPFRVALLGTAGATIAPGLVNGSIEPEVAGVALSGDDKNPAPALKWEKLKTGPDGRGYIALEVRFGPKWEILKEHGAEVVQVAFFDSLDETPNPSAGKSSAGGVAILPGRVARWPLAMVIQRKSGALALFQNTHGDLQVKPKPSSATAETGRAFFF